MTNSRRDTINSTRFELMGLGTQLQNTVHSQNKTYFVIFMRMDRNFRPLTEFPYPHKIKTISTRRRSLCPRHNGRKKFSQWVIYLIHQRKIQNVTAFARNTQVSNERTIPCYLISSSDTRALPSVGRNRASDTLIRLNTVKTK